MLEETLAGFYFNLLLQAWSLWMQTKLLWAFCNSVSSWVKDFTASLGNLFWCLTVHMLRNISLRRIVTTPISVYDRYLLSSWREFNSRGSINSETSLQVWEGCSQVPPKPLLLLVELVLFPHLLLPGLILWPQIFCWPLPGSLQFINIFLVSKYPQLDHLT